MVLQKPVDDVANLTGIKLGLPQAGFQVDLLLHLTTVQTCFTRSIFYLLTNNGQITCTLNLLPVLHTPTQLE